MNGTGMNGTGRRLAGDGGPEVAGRAGIGSGLAGILMEMKESNACLAVRGAEGAFLGKLKAVGEAAADDSELVAAMTAWRIRFRDSFASRFSPSEASTRKYLREISVAGPDRILFSVHMPDGRLAGHLGLAAVDGETADLDYLVFDPDKGDLEFALFSELTLCRYAFHVLGLSRLGADVLSSNRGAMLLHRLAGFRPVSVIPLDLIETGRDESCLRAARDPENPSSAMTLNRFEFHKAAMSRQHADWLRHYSHRHPDPSPDTEEPPDECA